MKKNIIFKDYFYAGLYQLLNVISPFLIIYLFLPIIGKSYYSNIILITALGSYFKLIYEFGFDYFTAKRVSKDSTIHTKEIVFSGVFSAKIILALIFFIPQVLVSMILINDREFYFVVLYCLSNILFSMVPNWYFLALQKFKQMAFLNLLCHSLIILCFFILITEEKYWYHYATGFLVGHLLQFIISLFVVDLKSTSFNSVFNINLGKRYLLNSFAILKFNILSNIYISSSVIILRILKTPPELITDFGIAEKVIRGIRQIISPINRIAYPRLIKVYKKSITIYNNRLIRFSMIIFSVGIILSFLVYENSLFIYKSLNYPVNDDLIIFTNLLLPILTIGSLGGFLCVNKFIARNREKQLINIMVITSVSFIVISPFLISVKSAVGGAIAVILSELLLFMLVIFKK